jgi:hypothetical protein
MTTLTKPISRETAKVVSRRPVIVTLAPCGGQSEALIGFRLKGERTQYTMTVSDAYRLSALWFGQKLTAAKKAARKAGIPWRQAKRAFDQSNRLG